MIGAQVRSQKQHEQQILLWFQQGESYLALLVSVCLFDIKDTDPACAGARFGGPHWLSVSPAATNTDTETSNSTNGQMFNKDDGSIQKVEVVTFDEDGSVAQENAGTVSSVLSYSRGAADKLSNQISGFLSRPIAMATFLWDGVQKPGENLFEPINLPNDYLFKRMVMDKLRGFRYFRCDFVVKVQVNAQPFNAGRMILWFEPFGPQQQYNPSNTAHFGGITGYRHVDLDLSESTAVELRIPYIAPQSHFDLLTGGGLLGYVRSTVYSALRPEVENIEGTVWVYAENVQFELPTGVEPAVRPNPLAMYAEAQIDLEGETKAASSMFPSLSKIFKAGGTIGKALGFVPTLGPFIAAGGWVMDALSGIAGLFGWSKPRDDKPSALFQQSYVRHYANYNGDHKTKMLALDARNAPILPTGLMGSSEDEMSFAHLFGKQIYLDRFHFRDTDPTGKVIFKIPVTPHYTPIFVKAGAGAGITYYSTMLSYFARLFRYWRGGINYHLKFVKTPFHSGRLRIWFIPGLNRTTDPKGLDPSRSYQKIVDIRETTSCDFTVPFVWNTPWRTTAPEVENPDFLDTSATGFIVVEVLNVLRNPSTAANEIEILVEVSGASDFQFAWVEQRQGEGGSRPRAHTIPGVPFVVERPPTMFVEAQALFEAPGLPDTGANQLGMGEIVVSTRQLLKRYQETLKIDLSGLTAGSVVGYAPFKMVGATEHNDGNPGGGTSFLDEVSLLYRCYSGNLRVMVSLPWDSDEISSWVPLGSLVGSAAFDMPGTGRTRIIGFDNAMAFTPRTPYFVNAEKVCETEVPFYQSYPFQMTDVGDPLRVFPYQLNDTAYMNKNYKNYGTLLSAQGKTSVQFHRSIGESFTFAYSIGPPLTFEPHS